MGSPRRSRPVHSPAGGSLAVLARACPGRMRGGRVEPHRARRSECVRSAAVPPLVERLVLRGPLHDRGSLDLDDPRSFRLPVRIARAAGTVDLGSRGVSRHRGDPGRACGSSRGAHGVDRRARGRGGGRSTGGCFGRGSAPCCRSRPHGSRGVRGLLRRLRLCGACPARRASGRGANDGRFGGVDPSAPGRSVPVGRVSSGSHFAASSRHRNRSRARSRWGEVSGLSEGPRTTRGRGGSVELRRNGPSRVLSLPPGARRGSRQWGTGRRDPGRPIHLGRRHALRPIRGAAGSKRGPQNRRFGLPRGDSARGRPGKSPDGRKRGRGPGSSSRRGYFRAIPITFGTREARGVASGSPASKSYPPTNSFSVLPART